MPPDEQEGHEAAKNQRHQHQHSSHAKRRDQDVADCGFLSRFFDHRDDEWLRRRLHVHVKRTVRRAEVRRLRPSYQSIARGRWR
jgi:hypothetical protein